MTQPILNFKVADEQSKAVANLLPCRIHHNGPVDPVATYWSPATSEDGTKIAYFRGRKLHGKVVKLPEQSRGVVVERKDEKPAHSSEEANDDTEQGPELGTMRVTAGFDEIVVWGHEAVADAAGDPYVRGIEEWLQVADKIHSFEAIEGESQK